MKIDVSVAQIISNPDFDNFSTTEVRTHYLNMKNDQFFELSSLRKRIYAELLKLVRKGWLKKCTRKKGATLFLKTELFDYQFFLKRQQKELTQYELKQKELINKLNHYKSELLLSMGESEAYKELYSDFPELFEEIKSKLNLAKENNTRILGKIKAIEHLLELSHIKEKL